MHLEVVSSREMVTLPHASHRIDAFPTAKKVHEQRSAIQAHPSTVREIEGEKIASLADVRASTNNPFVADAADYFMQESQISRYAGRPVTQFEMVRIFLEILKLAIDHAEQEKFSRKEERLEQIRHAQEILTTRKSQSDWILFSSIGAGVLGLAAGALPIVGYMKGEAIIDKLSGFFSSLKDMEADKFFKGLSKMADASAKISEAAERTHSPFDEGKVNFSQLHSDMRRTDHEECTRNLEEMKQSGRQIENFVLEIYRMHYETSRTLYAG